MFRIELLAAGHGDCLWVEYGEPGAMHRVLIDGGTAQTYPFIRERLLNLPQQERHFDLVVVTHIDGDHIEGLIPLLGDRRLGLKVEDIWFNGWQHISPRTTDKLGPVHGEMFSALIRKYKLPWNCAFGGQAVVIGDIARDSPKVLKGGMQIQLISPHRPALTKLRKVWKKEVTKAGLDPGNPRQALERLARRRKLLPPDSLGPGAIDPQKLAKAPFRKDTSVANGSSIAFLATFEGKICLFAGDAHPDAMVSSLRQLADERGIPQIQLDAFKVSHHGGRSNLNAELMDWVKCKKFLVSTNGNYFGHPHLESIARIITQSKHTVSLYFNYLSAYNRVWKDRSWKRKYNYKAIYPSTRQGGLCVDL